MADLDAAGGPNLLSHDHYEILGCSQSATPEDLTRAYRRLAWKYHPQNHPKDEAASQIFVRISEAYIALLGDGVDVDKRELGSFLTLKEAKKVYVNKCGKFRKEYFDEGGIIGLPHAFLLSERIGGQDNSRRYVVCGKIRVGFLRTLYLKTKIDWTLSLAELILTWGAIATCVLSFVLDDKYEWYLGVVGGIGLLLAYFLLSFWYGFTRFPILMERGFMAWLRGGDSDREEMEEIRDVCSMFFHADKRNRSQVIAVALCSPVMLIDQVTASISMILLSISLIPIQATMDVSLETELFLRGVAKSTGAVMSAIAYYSIWILGGDIVKAFAVGSLLVNQALYTSFLCRMGFWEFLGLVLFQGLVCFSSTDRNDDSIEKVSIGEEEPRGDVSEIKFSEDGVEVVEKDVDITQVTTVTEGDSSENAGESSPSRNGSQQLASAPRPNARTAGLLDIGKANEESSSNDLFSDFVVARSQSAGATTQSSGSSDLYGDDIAVNISQETHEDDQPDDFEVVDRYLSKRQLAPAGSRGPKTINFAGDVYSARVEEEVLSEGRSSSNNKNESSFQSLFQDIRQKVNQGFVAALMSASSQFEDTDKQKENEEFMGSITPATSASWGQSSHELSPIETPIPGFERAEALTIVGDIESSHGQSNFDEYYDDPPLELPEGPLSFHPSYSYDDDEIPDGVFIPTTNRLRNSDGEIPPPAYAVAMENATKQSILDKHSLSVIPENSGAMDDSNDLDRTDNSIESSQSPPSGPQQQQQQQQQRKLPPYSTIGREKLIPAHVDMLGTIGSVDDEDITIIGLDSRASSPSQSPARRALSSKTPSPPTTRRGRRPAPGKLDLPPEATVRGGRATKKQYYPASDDHLLSTKRCDQFVYFDPPIKRQVA